MSGNFWDNDPIAAPPMPPKAMSAPDQARIKNYDDGADEANRLASQATAFMDKNGRTPTGGLLAIPGAPTIAKATGIGGPDLSAMDRASMQMANAMKAPGSRLTQMEFGKYLSGVPNVKSDFGNNLTNAQGIYNARTAAVAAQSFMRTWQQTHGTLDGADAAWLQFQQQHFAPDGTYYHDPSQNPALKRAHGNAALKARSGQAGQQAADGATIDIFGRPAQ